LKHLNAVISLVGIFSAFLVFTLHPASAGSDRILTSTGLGPVRIGMTVPQAEKALGKKLKPLDTTDGISSESCWPTSSADGIDDWLVYVIENGKIVHVEVQDARPGKIPTIIPSVKTEKGIGIGSSKEQIRKQYGSSLKVHDPDEDSDGEYMMILDDDKLHGIFFEIEEDKLKGFYAATAESIMESADCSE